jgi:ribonucleotide monophosphatase NagD (HAD superfamily)
VAVDGALRLAGVRGFVFDVDGTLVHRGPDFHARPVPAAIEVLERIRRAAVGELRTHFKLPTRKLAVIGDDLDVDIRLGRMSTSHTILVRSGTAGEIYRDRLPTRRRPDVVIDTVADLLDSL